MLTQEEVRTLSQANRQAGWPEIPSTCPTKLAEKICEYRAGVLNGSISRSKNDAARKRKAEKLMAEIAAEGDADLRLKAEAASLLL